MGPMISLSQSVEAGGFHEPNNEDDVDITALLDRAEMTVNWAKGFMLGRSTRFALPMVQYPQDDQGRSHWPEHREEQERGVRVLIVPHRLLGASGDGDGQVMGMCHIKVYHFTNTLTRPSTTWPGPGRRRTVRVQYQSDGRCSR